MTKVLCAKCGSSEMEFKRGYYVCKTCGERYDIQSKQDIDDRSERQMKNLLSRADVYWSHGKTTLARKLYAEVLELDPDCEIALSRIGR